MFELTKAVKITSRLGEDPTMHGLDDIIIEVENRLDGGKPNKEYDDLFNSGV